MTLSGDIHIAADQVRDELACSSYDTAIILGSGLGDALSGFDCQGSLDINTVAGAPAGSIPGHAGILQSCRLDGRQVLVFQGRFHCYQGLSAHEAAWPVRLSAELGVSQLLVTSAVGGLAPDLEPGDFVLIRDHINLLGDNPLRGLSPPSFIDLVGLYQPELYESFRALAAEHGVRLHQGVLAAMAGPSYETPAEIEMLRRLGADVVSMSMVPEAIMARHLGMKLIGLALVTNLAAGLAAEKLTHQEVVSAGRDGSRRLGTLLPEMVRSGFSC